MTTNAVFPATKPLSPLARRLPLFLMALLLCGVLLLAMSAAPGVRAGATEGIVTLQSEGALVVNSTADTGDARPGDGTCDDGSGGRRTCTLRAAIEEANATAGTDTIAFDIAGNTPHVIRPETPLPAMTDPVVLDGTTEPDYAGRPVVVLDGALAGEEASGLVITAGDSTVRGLAINRFGYAGILLREGGNNLIAANHLGAPGQGNQIGVLADGSGVNTIGERNVVAGNEVGVYLYGAGAGGNDVLTNAIAGNETGVRITNAPGNTAGGNLIAGNESGIYIAGVSASDNTIAGNTLGLEADGRAILANGDGITINGAPGNIIGGESDGAGNTIAGGGWGIYIRGAQRNVVQGNRIGHDTTGAVAAEVVEGGVLLVDAAENTIGGTMAGAGNTITARLAGVRSAGAGSNVVEGNTIDVLEDDEEEAGVEIISTVTQVRGLPPSLHAGRIFAKPLALWEESAALQSGSTFTVDSTGDEGDANAGDGTCDDGGGACTLRAAIQEANATAGADTIAFSIAGSGPHTIRPGSELPAITEAVTLDGTTEPDYAGSPVVELDGSLAGASSDGLQLRAANTTVRGLAINRFDDDGIDLGGNADNALIEGNTIGLDTSGATALGNLDDGIEVDGVSGVTIGGTTAAARNIISANGDEGVEIKGGATDITLQGNYVGTDATGTLDRGNGSNGIDIYGSAASNTIGGTASGARNIIGGNDQASIDATDTMSNTIQGNYIGTTAAGTAALGNTVRGIRLKDTTNNVVGGTASGAGNLISGNAGDGINIYGLGTTGNVVAGNTIGLAAGGDTVLANGDDGVAIFDDATGNTIGGAASGAGNLISGNDDDGVSIYNLGTAGNTVQGNIIGADSTGTLDRGNADDGIAISDSAADNTILDNVISGNDDQGIYLKTTTGNVVQGNLIGTAGDGVSALGNGSRGIYLYTDPDGNTIGGAAAGEGNTIAYNGKDGVGVSSGVDNAIRGNAIFANSDLGIDLAPSGVTANDTDDGDSGANNLQNFPVLSAAHSNGSTTTITGTLNSSAGTQFALDFYASDSCDASGNGEGERYLGSDTVTTDGSGNASFASTVSTGTGGAAQVTATATDPQGNTSEFSACVLATYAASLEADFSASPTSGTAPLEVSFTDTSIPAGAADVWAWDFGDGDESAAQHPTHSYTAVGVFTVTLAVTDTQTSQTDTLVRSGYITVTATPFTDTWETITTTVAPPVSGEYAMAYDSARDVVVLYGGNAGGWPYSNDTWEFNGTDWAQVATATQPAAVYGMAMAYDAGRSVVVLFGGSDATDEELAETWEYNGTSWVQAAPTAAPPARTGAGLAYDAAGQVVYLFGGNDETTYYADLWQYDGATWSQVSAGTAPAARTLSTLSYHAGNGELYVFGGRAADGSELADLWAFDQAGWSQVNESGPAARYAHSLVYDIGTASLVLSGGAAGSGDTLRADTWHYQVGGGWTEGTGSGGTPATAYHGAVYDETDQAVILFQDDTTWRYR